jgi:sugar/nucleoside kinase (ribokinase family)
MGIPTKYTTSTAGGARPRAAVVVTNKGIDTTMIRQLSDTDAVTVEVTEGNTNIIAASMYFDRELQIETDLEKMERVLLHAKNTGVLIVSDTNARPALWNDRVTNERGRIL